MKHIEAIRDVLKGVKGKDARRRLEDKIKTELEIARKLAIRKGEDGM
jgi:hypothetical protein